MAVFMSTIAGKIDAKGRVSVPSVFRSVISAQNNDPSGQPSIFIYPSFTEAAIEGGGQILMDQYSAMLDPLAPFTEETDALANSLFADAHSLKCDADGRVSLPEDLLAHAGIEQELCFVGQRSKFQIWNPQKYAEFRARAREQALQNRALLRSLSSSEPPGGRG